MFTTIDKALAALIMALLSLCSILFGWNLGVTEETIAAVIAVLMPIVVYLVPNKAA